MMVESEAWPKKRTPKGWHCQSLPADGDDFTLGGGLLWICSASYNHQKHFPARLKATGLHMFSRIVCFINNSAPVTANDEKPMRRARLKAPPSPNAQIGSV